MTKKRNKKCNHMKNYLAMARRELKNVMVYFDQSNGSVCRLLDVKRGEFVGHSESTDKFLRLYRHKWNTTFMVAHRAPQSLRHDISESGMSLVNEEMRQCDIADHLNDHHQELYKSVNPDHISNVMWLASPLGQEIPEGQQLHNLIDKIGGFDALPMWERE